MGGCLSSSVAAEAGPQRLQAGHLLQGGKFRIVKALGRGSWADVFLVERMRDGRRYALKRTLIGELSETEKWVAVNEVRLLASLHHPNVVQYKQCFVEDNCLYVIMEVVPNGELAAAVEQHRREGKHIPEDKVWGYLLQIALGLQYLHAAGIIHRDIKPANILVGDQEVLKIADLGVAGLLHMGSSKLQIGTPQYMAPEMHAGREYSYAADVWSLGCLLYELCALEPLFQDREEEVVARKVLALALPPAIPAKYSPELQIIVNRMLQQDPEARPSIDQLLALPQLQSRMSLLPQELESQISQHSISFDCMEGIPVLPPIEVPEDLAELNHRLPPSRYSFDHMDEDALDIAARFGAPAIRRPSAAPKPAAAEAGPLRPAGGEAAAAAEAAHGLPRIASPVTVLESAMCGTPSAPGTSGSGSGSLSAIEAAVEAALLEEERMGRAAGAGAWRKGKPVPQAACPAAWAAELNSLDGAHI